MLTNEGLFTALITLSPVEAICEASKRGLQQIGIFDLTQDVDDPQTLILLSGRQDAIEYWATESQPSLVWYIPGDALSPAEGHA